MRVVTKDVGGSFGIKVHTYADEMATVALSQAAQAPGQVRGRPYRELRHRHPRPRSPREGQDRREERRHHHRLGDRRSHRHRPVFGLSAHLRHRGQPDRQSHRRPLHLPELSRPRARRVPEQERDVPVPRGRPSDRDRGDRGAGRAGRRQDRHGSAGDPAPQPHSRRCASVARPVRNQVRGAVAPRIARSSRCHDELRRAARRAEAAARARHLSRHRLCELHRGDQSDRPPSTASAAPGSRRRTASPSSSTRRARSSARPA